MRTFCFSSLTILLFQIIFIQVLFAQDIDRQRAAESKLKTLTQWTHRFSQGKVNEVGAKTSETHFDKNGNIVEIVNYRSSGEISSRLLYKYNNENLRTEYVLYQKLTKPTIEVSFKQTFHYNSNGLKTHESVFDGAVGYRITYEYNSNDELIQIVKYGVRNSIDEKWEYVYSGKNHDINVYGGDGALISSTKKEFDAKGNLVNDARFDAKGKEQKRTTYQYDSKGKVTEMAEYFSGNLSKKLHYKYNNQGLVVEVIQENLDGTKFTQAAYTYDAKGNIAEERWSDSKADDFSRKQSKFDKDGNILETDSYFAPYRYRVLYKYTYEYY